MKKKRAVIVGGGFGGVRAALGLSRHAHDFHVILIDRDGYHTYNPDYYELMSSRKGRAHVSRERFRLMFSTVTLSLAEIFAGKKNVELLQDEATAIDPAANEVETAKSGRIAYDALVVAPGSVSNFYGIPGLASRALELKTTEDALNIRNAIDEAFARKAKNEKISIVIGGGGFSGCEIAGEIASWFSDLAEEHGRPRDGAALTIVEGGPQLLMSGEAWFRTRIEKRLRSLGADIIVADSIVGARDGFLDLKSGKAMPFDVLVWTAGVKASPLAEKIAGAKLAKGSCIAVDDHLRVAGFKNIFAIGDVAFCKGFNDTPLPMTAQTAISQGRYAAYAIARLLHGRKTFSYRAQKSRFIIPLGGHYALASAGAIKLEGWAPWLLKRLVALKYFLEILPLGKALRVWWNGARM